MARPLRNKPNIPPKVSPKKWNIAWGTNQKMPIPPRMMASFSRTVLEAWAAGTPVVANAGSAVVSWHIERSEAGLRYRNGHELVEALRFIADEPEAAAKLAAGGRAYVQGNYRWSTVLDRMEATLEDWLPVTAMAGAS